MVSPWDFQPHDVSVPVAMWQGGLDTHEAPAMARYLAEQIPNAWLTFFDEEGHISLFAARAQEILSSVVAVVLTASENDPGSDGG